MTAPGEVDLVERATPVVRAGEVLVRPVANGLCGTDLELIDGTVDAAYVRYPLTLGHEWVGRRDAGTSGEWVDGDLVVVEGIVPDLTCVECRRGATNRCLVYDEIGFTRPGALADRIAVPAHLVHVLADGVNPLDAALVEPMAVVWRALSRARPAPGARCLVVGDGTVALLAAHLLGRFEPARVTMLGLRAVQEDLARAAGADEFLTTPPGESYDLVVEAAGQRPAVERALASVARGGTVVLLGLPPHGTRVEISPDDLVNNDVTIQASFSYDRAAWSEVVGLVNEGSVRPSFLVTHRFEFAEWRAAIETLRGSDPQHPRGKVMVTIGPDVL